MNSSLNSSRELEYELDSPFVNETVFNNTDTVQPSKTKLARQLEFNLESAFLDAFSYEPEREVFSEPQDEEELGTDLNIADYDVAEPIDQENKLNYFDSIIHDVNDSLAYEDNNATDTHEEEKILDELEQDNEFINVGQNELEIEEDEKRGLYDETNEKELEEYGSEYEISLNENNLSSAVDYNKKKMGQIGWKTYFDEIVDKVLNLNYSPNERAFAEAVAQWQDDNDLEPDGKLGPSTWAKMKVVLGLTDGNIKSNTLAIISTKMPISPEGRWKISKAPASFGTPKTIEALTWIANQWYIKYPEITLVIRDISKEGGGKLASKPGKYHKSHRVGLDADLQLLKKNGNPINTLNNYTVADRNVARDFIKLVLSNPVLKIKLIGFTESVLAQEFNKVKWKGWSGHNKHFHVRFCMPQEYSPLINLKKVYEGEERPSYICSSSEDEFSDFITSNHHLNDFYKEVSLNENDLNDAVNYNKTKKDLIGWIEHYDEIVSKVFKLNYSPNERAFAEAVAQWQDDNDLEPDGKLGPSTWAKMKIVLGLIGENPKTNISSNQIESIIENHRTRFGVSHDAEKKAALFFSNSKYKNLRVLKPSAIENAIKGITQKFINHTHYSLGLLDKTDYAKTIDAKDMIFVIALAHREGELFRTDNSIVISAGKDTHKDGVGGLDYLYKHAIQFEKAGIYIAPVDKNSLEKDRKNRMPAKIEARHMLFANMIEIAAREEIAVNVLKKVLANNGRPENARSLNQDQSKDSRWTWLALTYSGSLFIKSTFELIVDYAISERKTVNLEDILTHPLSGYKYFSRVILARATSLRAYVMSRIVKI